jgi:DNA repair exonuclease SbcCD ATPase subunit
LKIHQIYAKNFGSYAELDFTVNDQGISLIHGATGSGKSTIPDMISWGLFGVTGKNMNADDVKSWSSPDEPTIVEIFVNDIIVVRTRGKNANDLYWIDGAGGINRGKDLTESQRRLEDTLRVAGDQNGSACVYNESSPASSFFLANAKARRPLLESVTDLGLPTTLAEHVANTRKSIKQSTKTLDAQIQRFQGAVEQATTNLSRLLKQANTWDTERKATIAALEDESKHFEQIKASKIEALRTREAAWNEAKAQATLALENKAELLAAKIEAASKAAETCPHCGVAKGIELLTKLKGDFKLNRSQYDAKSKEVNPYSTQVEHARLGSNQSDDRINALRDASNPHTRYISDLQHRLHEQSDNLLKLQTDRADVDAQLSQLDQLYDLSFQLRGVLLQTAVQTLENDTNAHLETYFDSEFRVAFDASDGDSIEVSITKGGYSCTFRQLSKGQRQLLKLCFSVAVMKATAAACGQHFDALFLDEALDGLDATLKVKAFALFETLAQEHSSVFLIDHALEFQELFTNRFHVTIIGEYSQIERE